MFLVRTARTIHGTPSATAALAQLEKLQGLGQDATVTNLSGRALTASDLKRHISASARQIRH